jgi:hypothetical protein
VEDLDGEVLALLTEHRALLLLEHLSGPVMRVHDVVPELELDVLDLAFDLEILKQLFSLVRNGVLLRVRAAR